MFIIDFDDTLFDTHQYKLARLESLKKCGVSEEIFWNTYKKARNSEDGAFTYSDERHAKILSEQGFDEGKIFEALNDVNKDLKKFLFSDTVFFLENIKKQNVPMILLSLGDPKMQEMKVKGSGVDMFFSQMFMVHETKEQVVKEILDHHQESFVWFINDKVSETKELSDKFFALQPVLRKSPAIALEEYAESNLPYFSTLSEILKYVTTH